jgi:hypothetical protein
MRMVKTTKSIHNIKRIVIFTLAIIFSFKVYASCNDSDKNDDYILNLGGVILDLNLPFSSCPITGGVVRGEDKYAKEGGSFYANRGKSKCHFALDLEIYNSVQTNYGEGQPVYSAGDGVVRLSSKNWGAAGHTIIISHGGNYYSIYSHLKELFVSKGVEVKSGGLIGSIGYSGNAKKLKTDNLPPHLHFTVVRSIQPLSNWKPISVVKEIEQANDTLLFMEGFGFINPLSWLSANNCMVR